MADLRETQMWNSTSPEGLDYEIRFWGKGSMNEGSGMWNYYVYIHEAQLRPEDWERVWLPVARVHDWGGGTPSYDEYNSVLSEGEFHGGITFYEKRAAVDRAWRSVKVGCDYGHIWDLERGYDYRLGDVQHDALTTCRLLAGLLNPLVRCTWSGTYFDPRFDVSADVAGWKGGALSPAGLGNKSMWNRTEREKRLAA